MVQRLPCFADNFQLYSYDVHQPRGQNCANADLLILLAVLELVCGEMAQHYVPLLGVGMQLPGDGRRVHVSGIFENIVKGDNLLARTYVEAAL